MALSRRDFLARVGMAGGYGATFAVMQSLGILPMKGAQVEAIRAEPGVGRGTKVLVLGAGIAGLVSAYELRKLGYEVRVLEARERPGGRNWTGRRGTVVEFVDGTKQTIEWEDGNYQNMGPARLPSTHWTMLEYCRELGVKLEVEINTSRSTLLQNDKANGGRAIPQRKAINDTRGHVSELLAKCVARGALDQELSKDDRARMIEFLKVYGPLRDDGRYVGSERAGFRVAPGAGRQDGVFEEPEDMHMLLDQAFWDGMLFEEAWDWQATMMQPVGGMDRIPYAFSKALGPVVTYGAPVTEIRRTAGGVRVGYRQGGVMKQAEAAYCVVTLPFSLLKKVGNDFSAGHRAVIDGATMGDACKIPWESRRFWETEYNIYGGLSFLSQGPSPVWYPSADLMKETGIIVGGYLFDVAMVPGFAGLSIAQKLEVSRGQIEKLHPGHGKELRKGIYCGWGQIPWNEGAWVAEYGGGLAGYNTIIEPDGPFYFAGDAMSKDVGWQEGAALSARRVVGMISERVRGT